MPEFLGILRHSRPLSERMNARSPIFFLDGWYRLSGPADVPESAGFDEREQVRRGRVASLLILGLLCGAALLVPIIVFATPDMFQLPQVSISSVIGMICCLLAIPLNRRRQIQLVGLLLIIAADIIVGGIVLSETDGLNPLLLSACDLLVVSELIAVSLLTPASVFGVALLNILLLALDANIQPHSMMWMQMIQSPQLVFSLLARSAILYIVVAAVAYLWVNSASKALQRADRAELIAELERRELRQKREMEEAVEQILLVHTRVANGDLDARVPTYEHHVLWQISVALNNLLARFKSSAQSERTLQRVAQEITLLRMALRAPQSSQLLRWYPTEKNLLLPLADDLRRALLPQATSTPAVDIRAEQELPASQSVMQAASWPGYTRPSASPSWHGLPDSRFNSKADCT
jgi:hypothetical protein